MGFWEVGALMGLLGVDMGNGFVIAVIEIVGWGICEGMVG
jgi:hypothetical protein